MSYKVYIVIMFNNVIGDIIECLVKSFFFCLLWILLSHVVLWTCEYNMSRVSL